jgi:hypothetical protein
MPNLNELLAVIDNYKRRAKRNLSDLIESPADQYAEMLADRLPQLTEEMINDPANFLPGGGLLGSVSKKTKPLSESKFYSQYASHIDLRGRGGAAKDNYEKIMRDGFEQHHGINALPPHRGGKPLSVVDAKFRPQEGDYLYLAPKGSWENKPFGMQVQSGWKPNPYEVIQVDASNVGKSAYEMYLDALRKYEGD